MKVCSHVEPLVFGIHLLTKIKVLQAREAFLSDYEVYQQVMDGAISSRKRRGTKDQPGNLQTIQLEVISSPLRPMLMSS